MDIESLQIKRITGNWGTNQNYTPKMGELVMIAVNERIQFKVTNAYFPSINAKTHPFFIMGDGEHTIGELLESDDNKAYLPYHKLAEYLRTLSDTTPENIEKNASSGISDELSRADHTHKITKDTINDVVGSSTTLSEITLRKIYAGTDEPSPDDGSVGDIYIKYNEQ